jgi:hypothetical protein
MNRRSFLKLASQTALVAAAIPIAGKIFAESEPKLVETVYDPVAPDPLRKTINRVPLKDIEERYGSLGSVTPGMEIMYIRNAYEWNAPILETQE